MNRAVSRRYRLPPRAVNLVDQLALALDTPKSEIVADAVEYYAVLYNLAKTLSIDPANVVPRLLHLFLSIEK